MDAELTLHAPADASIPFWKGSWAIPFVLSVAGLLALSIDLPVAAVFKEKTLPAAVDKPLRDVLEVCETFGHGVGVTLIIIAVAVLDCQRRRDLPWVISGSLGAGVVANLIKLTVHRIRPVNFDLTAGSVWTTFDHNFSGGGRMESFPSSHTATAVGLALMLAALYPRGRWYFLLLALLVGLQRIVSSAHFPSDVCAGATVGWIVGTHCAAWIKSSRNLFN